MLAATDGAAMQRLIDPDRVDAQFLGEVLGWIAAGIAAASREPL